MTHEVQRCIRRFLCRSVRGSSIRAGAVALFALLLTGLPALAQLDTGSISGTVTDSSGGAVKDAAITAKETSTGTTYRTVSSGTGYYVFPSVRTGTYEVRAELAGFKTAVYSGVVVTVASHVGRDIALAVGAVSETVSVTADTLSLETESSEIDANITREQVYDLPLAVTGNLRSISSLEFLGPGRSRSRNICRRVGLPNDQDRRRPDRRNGLPGGWHHHQPAGKWIGLV